MIRPKTTTTSTPLPLSKPPTRIIIKMQRRTSSIWVIVQLCFISIQILATLVPLTNCDKQIPTASSLLSSSSPTSSSPPPPPPLHYSRTDNNGDKLLHRVARLTKLENYSLISSAVANTNKSSSNRDRLNPAGYMASNGLRTRSSPQKFYSQKERFNAMNRTDLVSLNQVQEQPKNICDGHCLCERNNNAFTTVTCDYQKNTKLTQVFDKSYQLPQNAIIMVIKLAAKTQFRLDEGFLRNTSINKFFVEGNLQVGEQVEINSNAFSENNGPYPEIGFLNVFAIIIRSKAFHKKKTSSFRLNLTNSNDVILLENAFENTEIRINLVGIKDLRIIEKAFQSAQARLHIEGSNIDNLFRFEASMQELKFLRCNIGNINPGTFDVFDIKLLIFESCRIEAIKSRAITDKLYSQRVSITNVSIGLIESDAIFGSGINELIITNNTIDKIHDNAIHVISAYVTITGNNIKHLGNNWLRVEKWSKFTMENNQFGIFGRMLLDNEPNTTCSFEGNSLTEPQHGSLNFTKPYCKIREISVNLPCRCDLRWMENLSDKDLRTEIYCTIDDKLSNCFNTTTFNFMKYLTEVCSETKTVLDCGANEKLKKINGRFYTPEELEQKNPNLQKLIIILAGTIFLLFLVIALVIFWVCRMRQKNSNLRHNESASGGRSHSHEFSVEERIVIDQTLQLIQKKYPEIYKKVNERIQTMFIADLSEEKCVKTTSQIVNLLNKIKNPGADFTAFNRVLTEHLQSPLPSAPPADQTPIYSEPSITGMDEGFYTSTTFSHMDGSADATGTGPEHIYAEPSCAQQPLLHNEYASPADGHLTSMDLYTEPINGQDSNLAAPYAVTRSLARPSYQSPYRPIQYATPMRTNHQHKQRQQLPDVLSQHAQNTTSLSNVRKIADDLQGKANFNPIAKPRNLHLVTPPTYTAPDKRHKLLTNKNSNLTGTADVMEMDMRGATALPPRPSADSGSNHSGGSNETVQIDDVIEYVDS